MTVLKRGALLRALPALALLQTTGCGWLKARLAYAYRQCPDSPEAPAALRDVAIEPFTLPPSNGIARVDVAVLAASGRPDKIVFVLPGRGGDALSAASLLKPFVHASKLNVAVVGVDGGESYWHPRASGENRLGMLLDHIVPWAERRWPSPTPRHGIIGMSMGAFGALNAAIARPALFDRVSVDGPALWQSQADQARAVPDAFDNAADFARYDPFANIARLRAIPVRICCGTHDPFYPAAFAFAAALVRQGTRVTSRWIENGCHMEETWRYSLPDDLAFAYETAGAG